MMQSLEILRLQKVEAISNQKENKLFVRKTGRLSRLKQNDYKMSKL